MLPPDWNDIHLEEHQAPTATKEDTDRLTIKTKLSYGLGTGAEGIVRFAVSTYAFIYYNQILGLPAHLAGIALSISLILDTLTDPLVASLSDRTRSRFGRRHLYMFVAPWPIMLSFLAIFNPPAGLSQMTLFCWFLASVMLMRSSMAFFHTPHLALGGELSGNYTERSKVMSYNSIFGWAGNGLASWVALSYFFKTTPEYPRGILNPESYLPFSMTMAAAAFLFMYASAWFTRDRIPYLPQATPETKGFSLPHFLKDITATLRNRNYVWLLAGYMLFTLGAGLRIGLHLYTNTYYWQLSSEELRLFVLATGVGFAASFYLTPLIHQKFEKKYAMIVAGFLAATIPMITILLGLAGIMKPGMPGLMLILSLSTATHYFFSSVLGISFMSALGDMADENEVKTGMRQQGMFYAAIALFAKIDGAVGAALVGFVLSVISFPEKAKVETIPHDAVVNLALWDGVGATIPGVLAVFFYTRYRITRASHAAIRATLTERRTASVAS